MGLGGYFQTQKKANQTDGQTARYVNKCFRLPAVLPESKTFCGKSGKSAESAAKTRSQQQSALFREAAARMQTEPVPQEQTCQPVGRKRSPGKFSLYGPDQERQAVTGNTSQPSPDKNQ